MDYVLLNSMSNQNREGLGKLPLVISYDISCQYFKNFFPRMAKYPASLQLLQEDTDLDVFVPKYHLNAHTLDCRLNYSLNFSPHVGRTDGEAPERGWAAIDALASSTKEMGPGSRRDTLDDHFCDQNWRKTIEFRACAFLRSLTIYLIFYLHY
jgi:hypothetical protein